MRLTAVLFQMSQIRSAKRVCKYPGRKAYYLTKSRNDVPTREWVYRDGAARKVLGDRDFMFGDELTRGSCAGYPFSKVCVRVRVAGVARVSKRSGSRESLGSFES